MFETTSNDPLKIILQLNQQSLNYLDQINIIVDNQLDINNINNSHEHIKIAKIVHWFSTVCPKINSSLCAVFFLELIESMAGSDAICIKDMTNYYQDQSKKLDRQWQQTIVSKIQQTPLAQSAYDEIATWTDAYEQILILCNEELIPMANRLLDNSAIQKLGIYFSPNTV